MSLPTIDDLFRASGGRDDAFAAAMTRAERASEPKPIRPDLVGRTRAGWVKRSSGEFFVPGEFFDPEVFEALPLLDVAQ